MNAPAIVLQDVTVGSMRDVTRVVLAGVNWRVAPGEFWVVAGEQQSGKSDLLLLMAGLMPPLAGTCQFYGRELRSFGEAELADRLRVGFVFAGGQLFNQLTLGENIALGLRYHRNLDVEEAQQAIGPLLELLELTPLAGSRPGNVSRDWQLRAALARALVLQPRLLLCDNPLQGLGPRHRKWWLRFLDELGRGHGHFGGEPMTVLLATDDPAPWKKPERRLALLRDKQFLPLGAWPVAAGSAEPGVSEWLAALETNSI